MTIPWIPLLTLGTQFLGGVLGQTRNEQTSSVTDSILNSTTGQRQELDVNSSSTQRERGVTSSDTHSSESTRSNQSSTQSSSNTSSTSGRQTGTGLSQETISRLDSGTQRQLTAGVQELLQSVGGGTRAIQAELDSLANPASQFDSQGFVEGIMRSATARAGSDFGSGVNNIRSRIGANSGTNSAAALLEAKLGRDIESSLAGVEADAMSRAEQLDQNARTGRSSSIAALAGQSSNELNGLLSSLLNATQTSSGRTTTANTSTESGQQSGTVRDTTTGTTSSTSRDLNRTNTDTTVTGSERQSQSQRTAGTTTQVGRDRTNAAGSSQDRDWTDLLRNIGDILSTGF